VTGELSTMRSSVTQMNAHLMSMTEKVSGVENKMRSITANVDHMNQSFRRLEPSVMGLGGNINNAAEPMKNFNSFFPW